MDIICTNVFSHRTSKTVVIAIFCLTAVAVKIALAVGTYVINSIVSGIRNIAKTNMKQSLLNCLLR
jgi:hypothetical protein